MALARCHLPSLRHVLQIASRITDVKIVRFFDECALLLPSCGFTALYPAARPLHMMCWRSIASESSSTKNHVEGGSSLPSKHRTSESSSVIERILEEERHVPTTMVEKIKETGKDISYVGIFLACLAITGALTYVVFSELFSGKSPNKVYSKALKMVKANAEVTAAIGSPIKGYGELSRRGRRRHVTHLEYVKDGVNYMRMKFYIEGNLKKGTVQLEVKEDENGQYEYRYLFVEVEDMPPRTIVLVDNR